MGILRKNGNISGKVGNIVHRVWGNETIVQGMPRKFKQTFSSIECSAEFGLASSTAARLREIFSAAFQYRDGKMVNRLNKKVLEALRASPEKGRGDRDLHDASLEPLLGFQFNNNSPLNEVLNVRPTSSFSEGKLRVSIPSFDAYKAIKGLSCLKYRLRLLVMAVDFRNEWSQYIGHQDMEVRERGDFPGAEISFDDIPEGTILMASLSLHALNQNSLGEIQELNSEKWCPAEIILAVHNPVQKPVELSPEEARFLQDKRMYFVYCGNTILLKMQKLREMHDSKSPPKQVVNVYSGINTSREKRPFSK